jgi:glycosyltransferase involved in cell wall biosynthesis
MLVAKGFQRPDIPRARQESRTLVQAGYPLYVLAWDRYGEFPGRENVDGAIVRSFTVVNLRNFSSLGLALGGLLFQIAIFFATLRLINHLRQRPIVHAHDINTLLPSCFLRVLGLSSALVYDCRELTYGVYSGWFNPCVGSIMRAIEEKLLRYADAVITVSQPIAEYLGRFKQMVTVIYNCPRTADVPNISKMDARKQLGLPLNSFIVSYVGMIRYGCRLELLLSVASRIKRENTHFVVVGGGPLAAEFRRKANQTLDCRITIVPRVWRDRALLYVLASDLTWALYDDQNLSLNVAMPWKLFESMACGVPVLVGQGSSRAKFVEKYGCGVVLQNDAPAFVAEAIGSLAEDPARHQQMSTAGKQLAASEFNWEVMSNKLIRIYEALRITTAEAKPITT